jgi:HSP20 family protein
MPYTWDPIDELRRMQYRMSQLFEEFPEYIESSRLPASRDSQVPYVDVIDREKDTIVTADLPGVEKSDIRINVRDNTLEISAEKKIVRENEDEGYIRRERGHTRFYRAIRLPTPVDESRAGAIFNNGVLEITLPKAEKKAGSNIPIK